MIIILLIMFFKKYLFAILVVMFSSCFDVLPIWIRRKGGSKKSALMNVDEGTYQLSHITIS